MVGPSNKVLKIRSDYVAAIGVALAPLIYFWPAWREGRALSPDDGVIFNIPLRVAAANLVRSGNLPLWNPYIFCGLPLHASAQAGLLFPLNWFYLISSPRAATNLMMLSTYALAAAGAYFYARRAGADIPGAIATSLVWQWCAFMVEQIGHTNIMQTAALLPWLLWAIDGYLAAGKRRQAILVIALLALQVCAGHQQTLIYSILLAGTYAFVMARDSAETRKRFTSIAIFMVAGLMLAALQILPTFELLRNSLRSTATYEFFGSFSLPPRFFLTFLAPYILGGGNGLLYHAPYIDRPFFGEYAAYAGLITIILAVTALVFRRDLRTKFWAIVFLVALFLAIGRFMPFGLYEVFYQVPLLNLFRSSSRHLMEVHFALAVLSGRGLTAIRSSRKTVLLPVTIIAGTVFLLTLLTVTWWRPAGFQLDRAAPVTLLRAPELFVPVFIAALSMLAVWYFARAQSRRALFMLFAVLALDLFLYGQGSAWRTHSPGPQHELWQEPEAVKFLREQDPAKGASPYRILTADQGFDPNAPVTPAADNGSGPLALQPDIYMMQSVANAAGYDGFGLARYSRLAGDMKVWGELTDGEGTLRGDSRALDLLNVRYLLARPSVAAKAKSATFARAETNYGRQSFAAGDLGLAPIKSGGQISFTVPPTEIDHLALLTNLAWSNEVSDHTPVAQIDLRAQDGKTLSFQLRAGEHTSEWAYDRADIRAQIKHQRAEVATSYSVDDPHGKYEAHTYLAAFALPARTVLVGGTIAVAAIKNAPDLSLSVARITLANGSQPFPLPREWIGEGNGVTLDVSSARWQKVADLKQVAIFENAHALPRAWLASEVKVLPAPASLVVIRTGRLPDGKPWDPNRMALVEGALDFNAGQPDANATAQVTGYEANRVMVKTKSSASSILVLSENHYSGWRAYVDGQLVDTLRVDYNLRGVSLPAGEHNVEFVYRPKSVLIGAGISLLTLLGMIVWWRRWLPEEKLVGILTAKLEQRDAPDSDHR